MATTYNTKLDLQQLKFLTNFIYLYEIGWIAYDKLRNRNDDSDSNNLKQEWIVEKDGSTFCFENKYWTGEYLMGNLGGGTRTNTTGGQAAGDLSIIIGCTQKKIILTGGD